MHGPEHRVIYPPRGTQVTEASHKIIEVSREHDSPALWARYEDLEADLTFVRGRAAFFRSQVPGLSKKAKRLADQARALVVNGGLSPHEATSFLLETAWAILHATPAPSVE